MIWVKMDSKSEDREDFLQLVSITRHLPVQQLAGGFQPDNQHMFLFRAIRSLHDFSAHWSIILFFPSRVSFAMKKLSVVYPGSKTSSSEKASGKEGQALMSRTGLGIRQTSSFSIPLARLSLSWTSPNNVMFDQERVGINFAGTQFSLGWALPRLNTYAIFPLPAIGSRKTLVASLL